MSASIITIISRIVAFAALLTGTASFTGATQDFAGDGNYPAVDNREIGLSVPAGPASAANLNLAGNWEGGNQDSNYTLKARVQLNPNGGYMARYLIQANIEGSTMENTVDLAGQWRVEGDALLLRQDSDGSVARIPFRLEGNSLSLANCGVNSGGMHLQRVGGGSQMPSPAQPGPTATSFPENPSGFDVGQAPASNGRENGTSPQPFAGTWYARGGQNGAEIKVRLVLNVDGSYRSDVRVSANGELMESLTDTGRWSVQNGLLVADSDSGTRETVPCRRQGDSLFLDYSQTQGFVLLMGHDPAGGSVRPAQPMFEGGNQQPAFASDW